jgi:hypothetical protein
MTPSPYGHGHWSLLLDQPESVADDGQKLACREVVSRIATPLSVGELAGDAEVQYLQRRGHVVEPDVRLNADVLQRGLNVTVGLSASCLAELLAPAFDGALEGGGDQFNGHHSHILHLLLCVVSAILTYTMTENYSQNSM